MAAFPKDAKWSRINFTKGQWLHRNATRYALDSGKESSETILPSEAFGNAKFGASEPNDDIVEDVATMVLISCLLGF
tara:strand:- start:1445 stop:1675 length:231 start_codon:yes stop_codon:yes gene_type:complete